MGIRTGAFSRSYALQTQSLSDVGHNFSTQTHVVSHCWASRTDGQHGTQKVRMMACENSGGMLNGFDLVTNAIVVISPAIIRKSRAGRQDTRVEVEE